MHSFIAAPPGIIGAIILICCLTAALFLGIWLDSKIEERS